jgi:hypothetical protein
MTEHETLVEAAKEFVREHKTWGWLTPGEQADYLPRLMSEFVESRTRKHVYWAAGEPECPKEIKASNGELHTLRCKVCGLDSPRSFCHG